MSSDNQLQQAVLAELKWEPSVTAAHIGVAANAGVVTLSGHVASFAKKLAAETAARRVKGVKALAEEIEVRLPFAAKKTDEEIAAAALDRLAWDVSVPPDFGVVGASNQISIRPKVNASNISDDIMHALHRSWFFDPKTINVSADGGNVRLSGTVGSWHERQVAAATAWGAPGITDVVNYIVII
jgi:osmotically-inducible protein OsmY